ncbi:MAG: S9 family peptidase [Kangiellaceae bacterium]|nr:S9 family peptidase [Kangiellaceae bacterium]
MQKNAVKREQTSNPRDRSQLYGFLFGLVSLLAISACGDENAQNKNRPIALNPTNPTVSYSYQLHNVEIQDDYHWLSQDTDPEVADWLKTQQQLTDDYFADFAPPKIEELGNQISYKHPQKHHYKIFCLKHNLLTETQELIAYNLIDKQEQVLYQIKNRANVIISTNLHPSGRYWAIQERLINKQYRWKVFDIANKRFIGKVFPINDQATAFTWLGSEPKAIFSSANSVQYHNLQQGDAFDYEYIKTEQFIQLDQSLSDWNISAQITQDSNYLIITATHPVKSGQRIWVEYLSMNTTPQVDKNNLQLDKRLTPLVNKSLADFEFIGNIEGTFYFKTNLAAPRNRIISIELNKPSRRYWKEVIAQEDAVLLNAKLINKRWLLHYLENTRNKIVFSSLNGSNQQQIKINNKAHFASMFARSYTEETLATVETITQPTTTFSLENDTIKPLLMTTPNDIKNNSEHKSEVVFYRSEDGSRIPLTLFSKANINKDGDNKVLLITHESFGSIFENQYHFLYQQWLELGHIIAVAHIRGGSTYGQRWQQDGQGQQHSKMVEDIIAGAEWLIDKNYTSPQHLALYGENFSGSMLAQSAITKPELFSVLVIADSELDYLNYLSNANWQNQFNLANDKESVEWLRNNSPYHQLTPKPLPALLMINKSSVKTSSKKLIAKWQNNQTISRSALLLHRSDETTQVEDNSTEPQYELDISRKIDLQTIYFLQQQL